MARAFALKFIQLVVVVFVVTALTFLLLNLLPGDPAISILGTNATPQAIAQLHHQLHLDDPLPVRYVHWIGQVMQGNFGESYSNHQPISHSLATHLPVTLEMLFISQVIAFVIAVPLGVWSAYRPNSWVDRASLGGSFAMLALPPFILAILFIYLFAVAVHAFPATGYTPLTQDPLQNLRSLFLPSLTLALGSLAIYVRVLRAEMVGVLQEDFITMARAKGMSTSWILFRHALRPSAVSLATVAGVNIGTLIGGSFIVEFIFSVPGIGLLTVDAIFARDYLVVQACVLVVAVGFIVVNFVVDLLYPLLDPRVRHAHAAA